MPPTCFKPRGSILRERIVYAIWNVFHASVWAVWWVGDCEHWWMLNIHYCIYNCLPEDEPVRLETCRRHQKYNINLLNCALCYIILSQSTVKRKHGVLIFLQRWGRKFFFFSLGWVELFRSARVSKTWTKLCCAVRYLKNRIIIINLRCQHTLRYSTIRTLTMTL
jgi:hypothetical protein